LGDCHAPNVARNDGGSGFGNRCRHAEPVEAHFTSAKGVVTPSLPRGLPGKWLPSAKVILAIGAGWCRGDPSVVPPSGGRWVWLKQVTVIPTEAPAEWRNLPGKWPLSAKGILATGAGCCLGDFSPLLTSLSSK